MRLPTRGKYTHPGEVLREEYLKPLEISQTEFANHLGVDFKTLNRLVNERQGVSVDLAIKLSSALRTTPEFWLNMQTKYDLTEALREKPKIPKILPSLKNALSSH